MWHLVSQPANDGLVTKYFARSHAGTWAAGLLLAVHCGHYRVTGKRVRLGSTINIGRLVPISPSPHSSSTSSPPLLSSLTLPPPQPLHITDMPGLELYGSSEAAAPASTVVELPTPTTPVEEPRAGVYYNPRLDPKNYLEGPLSLNAATRLRQMLARPGIVVAPGICDGISARCAIEAGFTCLYQR